MMGHWISVLFGLNKVQVGDTKYTLMQQTLGEGAFSFVDLVTHGDHLMALKRIEVMYQDQEQAVLHEINILRKLKHPNIISLLNHDFLRRANSTQQARLVFPYYSRGTVQDWISREDSDHQELSEKEQFILSLSYTICDALYYMHSLQPPLAHRDMKPANVLITDDGEEAVLMDLGSVREAEVRLTTRREAIMLQERAAQESTSTFRAPELFDAPVPGLITAKTDVWSLGCTMFAMAYGDPPFDGTVMSTLSGRVPIPTLHRRGAFSPAFNELLKWMLSIDTEVRSDVLQVRTRLKEMIA